MKKLKLNNRISVGIPAFNQGEYLKQTIESLLNQTHPPFEIVVSDNWSTDNTRQIIESFHGKVKLIFPPTHLPTFEHFNFLCSNLKGEWLSLLSSDDVAKPNYVESLSSGIEKSDKAILIRAGQENIDRYGKTVEVREILTVKKITTFPENVYEQLLGPKTSFSAFAVRKNIWEKVGGFPLDFTYDGDWVFWLKIARYGDFIYVPRIISGYRIGYRDNLERDRLLGFIGDEVRLYNDFLYNYFPDLDKRKFAKASKKTFYSAIGRVQNLLINQGDIVTAVGILSPWATSLGINNDVRGLIYGKKISNIKNILVAYIKKKIRPLIQCLRFKK